MLTMIVQIFIGSSFPGSLLISLLGIYYKRPYYLVIGSLLSIGFACYLTGSPLLILHTMGYFLPLSHIFALLSLRIKKNWGYYLVGLPYGILFITSLLGPLINGK
jgi:hypothetical protein